MDELTRQCLIEQLENIIADYEERELSETDIEDLNYEELKCISECLQFGQFKSRLKVISKEIENLKKCYLGADDAVMKPISFEDYIQEIIDSLN